MNDVANIFEQSVSETPKKVFFDQAGKISQTNLLEILRSPLFFFGNR
jgi:hypothetical protein